MCWNARDLEYSECVKMSNKDRRRRQLRSLCCGGRDTGGEARAVQREGGLWGLCGCKEDGVLELSLMGSF